ncbi:MAG: hypothetical protein CBB71_09920 [Rhodopirellula sp. TMED11]|nr:MAG: hypothetical protein CBB71_09920 [Rhodopirellula sp. TMED11]
MGKIGKDLARTGDNRRLGRTVCRVNTTPTEWSRLSDRGRDSIQFKAFSDAETQLWQRRLVFHSPKMNSNGTAFAQCQDRVRDCQVGVARAA